jgi:hypothetical protein
VKLSPLRTPAEKADLEGSWLRSDEDFFGAGACHVLASAFLGLRCGSEYRALLILPSPGHRGRHVVAANAELVFDFNGYTERSYYFAELERLQREREPTWAATLVELEVDPAGWDFCRRYAHRHPSQFFRDPLPRARAFILHYTELTDAGEGETSPSAMVPPRAQSPTKTSQVPTRDGSV